MWSSSSSPPCQHARGGEGGSEMRGRQEKREGEKKNRGHKKNQHSLLFPPDQCHLLSTRRTSRLEGWCPSRSVVRSCRASCVLLCVWVPPTGPPAPRTRLLLLEPTSSIVGGDDNVASPSSLGRHRTRSPRRRSSPRSSSGSRRTETLMTTSACSSPG